ncbi:unnamed protein product, partial [marine sediment metagenome]
LFGKMRKENLKVLDYYILGNFKWVVRRWINVFFKYVLKSNFKLKGSTQLGFCDWVILAEKTK